MNNNVEKAKKIVKREYKYISKLSDISKNTSCSYNTLRSDFVRETGFTLGQYLNKIRCQKAEYLLSSTDWKLYRIAKEVGYHDEKYFMKKFKKLYGKCPSKLRN
jgi:two-component system response regulator YesN